MLYLLLASVPRLSGASKPLSFEGLDPTVFGSTLDKSARRIVNGGEELRAYLSDVTVSTLVLNGKCIASATSSVVLLINLWKPCKIQELYRLQGTTGRC